MTANLTFYVEIALTVLLAATLVYCIILERRLVTVRRGQDGLKSIIADLNAAITTAGASLRALKSTASTAGEALDQRLTRARASIDELSLLTASSERIAERMERVVDARTPSVSAANTSRLPSGSVMHRLDSLKAVR